MCATVSLIEDLALKSAGIPSLEVTRQNSKGLTTTKALSLQASVEPLDNHLTFHALFFALVKWDSSRSCHSEMCKDNVREQPVEGQRCNGPEGRGSGSHRDAISFNLRAKCTYVE